MLAVPLLVGITFVSFLVIHLAPGDPLEMQMGELSTESTAQAKQMLQELYGLDKPLPVQYWNWLSRIVRLDFGRSFTPDGRPVLDKIRERLPITLLLNLIEMLIILAVAVPIGILSATRQYSLFDKVTTVFVFLGFATPDFWLALLLMILFGVQLGWLPISGLRSLNWEYLGFWTQQWDFLSHLILPIVVATFGGLAGFSRYMRQSMLEVVRQDYIQSARAKGLAERVVIGKHALRNAMLPIVTILGLSLPGLIGGSVIVESVFAIPGMGQLMVQSVFQRDYPVIMANLVIVSVLTLLANLVADLSYGLVDPRIRLAGAAGAAVRAFGRAFIKNRLAVIGGVVVFVLAVLADLRARALARATPTGPTCKRILDPPSAAHALGTDQLGRDVLSRMLYGARVSLAVGFVSVGIAAAIGIMLGSVAGYNGGLVDAVVMRLVDLMLVFPRFFLLLAVLAFLKPSIWTIMVVIGLTGWMGVTRLVRAEFLSLKEREFVVWSQSVGASGFRVVWRHILPNAMAPGAGGHDPRHSRGHPDRVGTVVPRARRATPVRHLGQHPQRGQGHDRDRLVAFALSRPGHPRHGALLQPARRRHPRRARSPAAPDGRSNCHPRTLTVYSVPIPHGPKWRNWQTRTFEGRVGQPVGVRVPPSAPLNWRGHEARPLQTSPFTRDVTTVAPLQTSPFTRDVTTVAPSRPPHSRAM